LEVSDPAGRHLAHYSGNLRSKNGIAEKTLPIAMNDVPGKWLVQISDILSGEQEQISFEVIQSR
jgi:hypothetical protein